MPDGPTYGGFDAGERPGYPVEAKTNGGSRSADTPLSIKEIQENLQKRKATRPMSRSLKRQMIHSPDVED
jgi:hypothetical protein